MSSKPRPLSQPSASSGSSHQHPHPHTVTSSRPFPSRSASSGLTPLTPFPSSPGDSRQGTDAGDDEDGDVASLPSLVRSLASFPMMTSVDVRQLNFGGGVGTRQASQEKLMRTLDRTRKDSQTSTSTSMSMPSSTASISPSRDDPNSSTDYLMIKSRKSKGGPKVQTHI